MSLGRTTSISIRSNLPPLKPCESSNYRLLSPNLTSNDTLTSINSPRFKNNEFITINMRRVTELVQPTDNFVDKFERMSKKLEKVLGKVQKKYSCSNIKIKSTLKRSHNNHEEADHFDNEIMDGIGTSPRMLVKRPTLNRYMIRSQLFETTSKWLSPREQNKSKSKKRLNLLN